MTVSSRCHPNRLHHCLWPHPSKLRRLPVRRRPLGELSAPPALAGCVCSSRLLPLLPLLLPLFFSLRVLLKLRPVLALVASAALAVRAAHRLLWPGSSRIGVLLPRTSPTLAAAAAAIRTTRPVQIVVAALPSGKPPPIDSGLAVGETVILLTSPLHCF